MFLHSRLFTLYLSKGFEFLILNFQTQNINSPLWFPTAFVKFIGFQLTIVSLLLIFLFNNASFFQSSEFLLCIFCFSFSDWFMMCLLFHLSGSSFNISLSFSRFLLWLPGFPLSPLPPQSVRLLREIGFCQEWNFLVLSFYSLPLRIVTSFCTRSIFVLKT